MKQQIYALIALSLLTFCTCKNCIDSKTSKNFNFDISLISKDENNLGKAEIIVKIIDKKRNEEIQKISFMSEFILKSESFKNCKNNKSYSSNAHLISIENDFGDLIVADLNFDGKEDIAIKREEGGNGGPLYNYYIQSESYQFILDEYLSNEMIYFPDYIDNKGKSLHVTVRANSLTKEGLNYHYDKFNNVWSKSRSEIFNH